MNRSYYRHPYRPARFHAAAALTLAALLALGLWLGLGQPRPWPWLLAAWLVGINLTTAGYYGYDKLQAIRAGRRVPERVLHGLALVGGSLGAYLAMRLFRHKTLKGSFRQVFWVIVVLQAALVGWVGWEIGWRG